MSLPRKQLDKNGSLSQENAPRVVVRAGKYFICSSCGTMVEIPADVVGKLVSVAPEAPPEEPVAGHQAGEKQAPGDPPPCDKTQEPAPTANDSAVSNSLGTAKETRCTTAPPLRDYSPSKRPACPDRPRKPRQTSFTGQIIDGLRVPSAEELDRALAWIAFHLKVLDRQGAEVKRLQKLLKQRRSQTQPATHMQTDHRQIPADTALGLNPVMQRGPPA